MKRMTLGVKLLIAFLAVGLLPLLISGIISLRQASHALNEGEFHTLIGIREIKKTQIENFFAERQGDMEVLMETVSTLRLESFAKLSAIQSNKKIAIEQLASQWFIDIKAQQNRSICTKAMEHYQDFIETGDKSSEYIRYDSIIDDFVKKTGYHDFFVIDTDGIVVHSQAKEADYQTNLLTGPYKDSGLARAYREAANGKTVVIDFSPYAPSNGEPAAFLAAPIMSRNTQMGVVAMQVSMDKIQHIMNDRTGLGKTGEVYLVGSDKLMRSDSFLDPANHSVKASFANPGRGKVDTEAVRWALAGESRGDVIIDYNGNPVLSMASPIDIHGLKWAVLAEIDLAEAFSPVDTKGNEFYKKYVEAYGYYDLFLISPTGYCFYTAAAEKDKGTNFQDGKYASSNLGELFREVIKTKEFGIADFAPYAPSNDDPAAFIARPVLHNGDIEMVVALQLSLEAINGIMQQREGLGKTGETYLVGPDKLMRSDSHLDPTNHTVVASFARPETGKVDTEATKEALAGQTGAKIITDYNGAQVLSAFTPVQVGHLTWALIAEIDEAEAMEAVSQLTWIIGTVMAGCLVLIIIMALMISRSITVPVKKTMDMLSELGKGHLNDRLAMNRADEIGQMADTMDNFANTLQQDLVGPLQQLAAGDLTFDANVQDAQDEIGNALEKTNMDLNRLISEISMATGQIASGSDQVSSTSQSLSQGATEQAASIEEISSSMTQMSSQTNSNADNADQANKLASGAQKSATQGHSQMKEMVGAMNDINESGQNISKIIKVIDEIAFQTNLLALNAAVEAARAGQHGKGFAVVAEEVRNLAARSAKAASETAELIESSVSKTERGMEIANHTSTSLDEIVTAISKVSDLVAEIATASREQSEGIGQVSEGISQVDQVTQSNTAAAEEGAAAAEELSSQAVHMRGLVSAFQIKGVQQQRVMPQQPVAPRPQAPPQSALAAPPRPAPKPAAPAQGWPEQTAPKPQPQAAPSKPSEVISLDDDEFGKY